MVCLLRKFILQKNLTRGYTVKNRNLGCIWLWVLIQFPYPDGTLTESDSAYGSPAGESDCPWAMAMNGSDIHGLTSIMASAAT